MIYQIKITVKNVIKMSRTILVKSDMKFEDLHMYINKIFGLSTVHLYDFKYEDQFFINMPSENKKESKFKLGVGLFEVAPIMDVEFDDESDLPKVKNYCANNTSLLQIFENQSVNNLQYVYDFGDYRDFDLQISKKNINAESGSLPRLIAAEGGNLIEDCGGPNGYNDLLVMIGKKKFDDDLFESEEDFALYIKPIMQKIVLD